MNLYVAAYRLLLPRRYRSYLRRAGGDRDMVRETLLYGTFFEEYVLYGFASKSDSERRQYLTDAVRNRICRRINSRQGQHEVEDKWLCYSRCKEFYKRQAYLLQSPADARQIASLYGPSASGQLVAKPADGCGGRGVRLLRAADTPALEQQLEALLAESGRWIVEERIVQGDEMARWNADSVNTVRMNTIVRDGKVLHYAPFILVGRRGSFVNNGAKGGLFASVDAGTGTVITDGFDESGGRYASHPDSGLAFRGWRVPRWGEVLSLTERMALRFPGVTYIGWDLALTPDGWVCVEANKGEFVAQQTTLERGLRSEFETLAGVAENK